MASKPKGRRRKFNLRKVTINTAVAAGALAAGDVIGGAVTASAVETYRLMSVDCSYNWSNIGAIIDDGATFGLAHGDYTDAEIEECLEATGSIDLGDKLAQEKTNRLVRSIGTISNSGALAAAGGASFADGRRVKTKLNWEFQTGKTLTLWIRNASATVWTTASSVTMAGDIWIKNT